MHFLYISFFLFTYYICVWMYMILFLFWLMHLLHIYPLFIFMFICLFVLTFLFPCDRVLSIASPTSLPFQKVCGNCHIADVIICPMGSVHCNTCHSKSTIHKSCFLRGSIATNDELMLLIIKGKWLEAIVQIASSTPHFNSHSW
jgi:hypothetical protein